MELLDANSEKDSMMMRSESDVRTESHSKAIEHDYYASSFSKFQSEYSLEVMPYHTTFAEMIGGLRNDKVLMLTLQLFQDSEQVKTATLAMKANSTAPCVGLILPNPAEFSAWDDALPPDIEWEPLLETLEGREDLSEVYILGVAVGLRRNITVPDHILRLLRAGIFPALKRNASIRSLGLSDNLDISGLFSTTEDDDGALISFLNGAPSVDQLSLHSCRAPAECYAKLADALQCTTNLRTLSLRSIPVEHINIILQGLASRQSDSGRSPLVELAVKPDTISETLLAQYLQSPAFTIEVMKLEDVRLSEDLFRELSRNATLNDIRFQGVSLESLSYERNIRPFSEFLKNTQVSRLELHQCGQLLSHTSVLEAFRQALARPKSPIQSLHLSTRRLNGTEGVLAALSNSSSLVRLTLETNSGSFSVPRIADALTFLRVNSLTLVTGDVLKQDDRQRFLHAIKKNVYLQNVAIEGCNSNSAWLRSNEHTLKCCTERNAKLCEWRTKDRWLVPENLWCYALAMTSNAGRTPLFHTLKLVADGFGGKDVETIVARKNIRPEMTARN